MRDFFKAIADLPPGEWNEEKERTSYTHLLPEEARNSGYELHGYDEIEDGLPMHHFALTAPNEGGAPGRYHVGHLDASRMGEFANIHLASIRPEHRGKGLGMVMYEGMLRHLKDKGATHVFGGNHSSMAHRVHAKIAAKHGLTYKANHNTNMNTPGSYDDRFGPYRYTIKSENDVEDFMPVRKKEVKVVDIPSRFLAKAEPNLIGAEAFKDYEDIAMEQMGAGFALQKNIECARRLAPPVCEPGLSLSYARRLMDDDNLDPAGAALRAHGLDDNEINREALRITALDMDLAKADPFNIETYKVVPANSEAVDMANAVQRAADSGYINPVKLNGKHSKGSMLAKDPQTRKVFLLKPGAGQNSPALGVNEDDSTQSEREAAFWHVADALGIGDTFPRADLILVNGHQTAAMELLPVNYRNLGQRKKEDPNMPVRILEPYRQNGMIHKWAFIDYVLGNPDRHSQNMMVDPDNRRIRLIDHGSAMAGPSFNPSEDDNSFIPFYLRAWTGRKFTKMKPEERLRAMPGLDRRSEQVFDEWVMSINPKTIATILEDYNINPEPALRRFAQIRAMPGPKWLVLNKVWSGAI